MKKLLISSAAIVAATAAASAQEITVFFGDDTLGAKSIGKMVAADTGGLSSKTGVSVLDATFDVHLAPDFYLGLGYDDGSTQHIVGLRHGDHTAVRSDWAWPDNKNILVGSGRVLENGMTSAGDLGLLYGMRVVSSGQDLVDEVTASRTDFHYSYLQDIGASRNYGYVETIPFVRGSLYYISNKKEIVFSDDTSCSGAETEARVGAGLGVSGNIRFQVTDRVSFFTAGYGSVDIEYVSLSADTVTTDSTYCLPLDPVELAYVEETTGGLNYAGVDYLDGRAGFDFGGFSVGVATDALATDTTFFFSTDL